MGEGNGERLWRGLCSHMCRCANQGKHGGYRCNEYGGDTLIPTLEHVLTENRPASWTPIEPDAKLAFYPEMVFPFMCSSSNTRSYKLIYESDESRQEREDRAAQKALFGKLPNDPFTVIAFADAYNFERAMIYTGSGPALILVTNRLEVENFLYQLKEEYAAFQKAWNLPPDPDEMVKKTHFKGKEISQDDIRKAVRAYDQQTPPPKQGAGRIIRDINMCCTMEISSTRPKRSSALPAVSPQLTLLVGSRPTECSAF
jgi:hypothetical protein